MFRLGTEKRVKPVTRAERAGAAVGRQVDKIPPKVAIGYHRARDVAAVAGAEAKVRGKATYHALKGDIRAPEPSNHRKRNIALAVGAVGAAATAAYMTARRRRQPEWMTTDITPTTKAKTPDLTPGQPATAGTMPTRSSTSGRSGDRGGASPDEMISDAAESVSGAAGKASETTHKLRAQ